MKPNQNSKYPIQRYKIEIYGKPTIKNSNIIIGDFTYVADSKFKNHITNFIHGAEINSLLVSSARMLLVLNL